MYDFEPFVDAAAAAQFLGCSRSQLLRLARQGKVPAHPLDKDDEKVRRTWRFKLSELDAFMMNGGTVRHRSPAPALRLEQSCE